MAVVAGPFKVRIQFSLGFKNQIDKVSPLLSSDAGALAAWFPKGSFHPICSDDFVEAIALCPFAQLIAVAEGSRTVPPWVPTGNVYTALYEERSRTPTSRRSECVGWINTWAALGRQPISVFTIKDDINVHGAFVESLADGTGASEVWLKSWASQESTFSHLRMSSHAYLPRKLKKAHFANALITGSFKILISITSLSFKYLKINIFTHFGVCEYWVGVSIDQELPLKEHLEIAAPLTLGDTE